MNGFRRIILLFAYLMSIQGWLNSRVLFKELSIRKMATFPRLVSSRLAMSTLTAPKAAEKPVQIANEKLMYVGDFVVHESYGIGKYAGSKNMKSQFFGKGLPVVNTYYIIKFADTDIFVESDQLKEKVFFFSPRDDPSVRIDTALSTKWEKKKRNFKSMNKRFSERFLSVLPTLTSFRRVAASLINTIAIRNNHFRTPCLPDGKAYQEFEEAFPFTPTVDQLRCFEVNNHLISLKPSE
jgi:transcription-repair coupling factor (superfamily II helicase)